MTGPETGVNPCVWGNKGLKAEREKFFRQEQMGYEINCMETGKIPTGSTKVHILFPYQVEIHL